METVHAFTEFTRECLAIDVARKLNHDDVLERLAWLMATRGVSDHIRCVTVHTLMRR